MRNRTKKLFSSARILLLTCGFFVLVMGLSAVSNAESPVAAECSKYGELLTQVSKDTSPTGKYVQFTYAGNAGIVDVYLGCDYDVYEVNTGYIQSQRIIFNLVTVKLISQRAISRGMYL